jgi:hypothetical protein
MEFHEPAHDVAMSVAREQTHRPVRRVAYDPVRTVAAQGSTDVDDPLQHRLGVRNRPPSQPTGHYRALAAHEKCCMRNPGTIEATASMPPTRRILEIVLRSTVWSIFGMSGASTACADSGSRYCLRRSIGRPRGRDRRKGLRRQDPGRCRTDPRPRGASESSGSGHCSRMRIPSNS